MNGVRYPIEMRMLAIELYQTGLSASAVAKKLGLKPFTIKEWLVSAGAIRTMSEAASLAIRNGQLRGFPRQHLVWTSTKTGETHYADSRYEIARMAQLDADPIVAFWSRCLDQITYTTTSGKLRRYVPDFFVTTANRISWVEEIKPRFKAVRSNSRLKHEAAVIFYKSLGIEFRVVTEHELAESLAAMTAVAAAKPYDGVRAKQQRRQRLARETANQSQNRKDKQAKRARGRRQAKTLAPFVNGLLGFGM